MEFENILRWFDNVTNGIMNEIAGQSNEQLFEYDKVLFLRKINGYELEREYEDGTTKKYEMTVKEFHKVITYCESTGEGWW
jgi:hypothetical protein